MKRCPNRSRAQRGQSLVEFCIVVPLFLFLVLGIFQFVLVYRAKTTLDYAVLEAARSGAVHGAEMSAIRSGLARGLTPLHTTDASLSGIAAARLRAETEARLYSQIKIVSPTKAAWDDFAERQFDGRRALPNDNLAFRDPRVGSSGVSVQDANILKIRVRYHYPMIVPFVDRVIEGTSNLIRGDWRSSVRLTPDPLGDYSRIPIESYAIVRMQSPIKDRNALGDGKLPAPGPGGAGGGGPGSPGGGGGPDPNPNPNPNPPGPGPGPGDPAPPVCG